MFGVQVFIQVNKFDVINVIDPLQNILLHLHEMYPQHV